MVGLPTIEGFIESLPEGLASYPDCHIRRDVIADLRDDFPDLVNDPNLPAELRAPLLGEGRGVWMTEVHCSAIFMFARDVMFNSDQAFLDWNRTIMERLFAKPLYRVIMALISPSLAALNAGKRWAHFHRGTTMEPSPARRKGDRIEGTAVLEYPPHMYCNLSLRQHANTVETAVVAANAKDARVELVEDGVSRSTYYASWAA